MRSFGKAALLASTSLMLAAQLAIAQTAQVAETPEIPEITITALHKNESLTNTPASVTAFDASTLENAGVKTAADFIALTPGVSIVAGTAEAGDSQVNIRGINGARDAESSFAFVLDGISMSNPAAFNREFTDLQQIEVLKGPQSALYGRNAEAGAIVVTTRKPSNELEASSKTGLANNNTFYNQSTVSGPIIKDQLYARLSADYRNTDGFYTNRYTNEKSVDNGSNYNVNARIVWDPAPDWELDLKGRYGHIDQSAIRFNAAFELPAFTGGAEGQGSFYENVNQHQFDYVNNVKPENLQDSREVSLKVDHDMGWAKLTAWGLYSEIDNNLLSDGTVGGFGFFNKVSPVTGTNVCANSIATLNALNFKYPSPQSAFVLGPYTATTCDGYQYQVRDERDFSFEARLASPQEQRLRWGGGLFYLHIDRHVGVEIGEDLGLPINKTLYNPLNSTSPTAQLFDDSYTTNVYAAFGSLDYDITKELVASAALRWDVEERDVTNNVPTGNLQNFVNNVSGGAAGAAFFPLNPGLIANPNGIPSQSKTFDQPQPRVSLRWSPETNLSVYATVGVGFKSGGFNSSGSAATVAKTALITAPTVADVTISDTYKKETSDAYEIGVKGSVLDKRVSYQVAGYYTQVYDMQFFEFFSSPLGLLRVDSNIDRVDLHGFEVSTQARLLNWLTANAGLNMTDSEILKNSSRPNTVGNKSPYTPDYTANLGLTATQPITEQISALARIDTNFIGDTWFHTVQSQSVPTIFGVPGNFSQTKRAAYSLTNLRFGITSDHFDLTAFVSNLLDKRYLSEVIPAPEFGGAFVSQGDGRLIGAEATYRF